MEQLLVSFHLIVCVILAVLVLLQQGKGAEAGAAMGSGGAQSLFGSQGSAHFLSRSTAFFAALFFLSNLALGYYMTWRSKTPLYTLHTKESR